jgi:hypothetical protein
MAGWWLETLLDGVNSRLLRNDYVGLCRSVEQVDSCTNPLNFMCREFETQVREAHRIQILQGS